MTNAEVSLWPTMVHHSPLRMSHDDHRNAKQPYLTKTQEIIAVTI